MGAYPFWVYEPARVKPYMTQIGRLNLTASAFNQLGRDTSSSGHMAYCCTELAFNPKNFL